AVVRLRRGGLLGQLIALAGRGREERPQRALVGPAGVVPVQTVPLPGRTVELLGVGPLTPPSRAPPGLLLLGLDVGAGGGDGHQLVTSDPAVLQLIPAGGSVEAPL